ncbi:MAG: hypothetical protein LBU29_03540, partial [Endomicrobium sp.]|nr:hypothetical protein [Endomicrobium sp.]
MKSRFIFAVLLAVFCVQVVLYAESGENENAREQIISDISDNSDLVARYTNGDNTINIPPIMYTGSHFYVDKDIRAHYNPGNCGIHALMKFSRTLYILGRSDFDLSKIETDKVRKIIADRFPGENLWDDCAWIGPEQIVSILWTPGVLEELGPNKCLDPYYDLKIVFSDEEDFQIRYDNVLINREFLGRGFEKNKKKVIGINDDCFIDRNLKNYLESNSSACEEKFYEVYGGKGYVYLMMKYSVAHEGEAVLKHHDERAKRRKELEAEMADLEKQIDKVTDPNFGDDEATIAAKIILAGGELIESVESEHSKLKSKESKIEETSLKYASNKTREWESKLRKLEVAFHNKKYGTLPDTGFNDLVKKVLDDVSRGNQDGICCFDEEMKKALESERVCERYEAIRKETALNGIRLCVFFQEQQKTVQSLSDNIKRCLFFQEQQKMNGCSELVRCYKELGKLIESFYSNDYPIRSAEIDRYKIRKSQATSLIADEEEMEIKGLVAYLFAKREIDEVDGRIKKIDEMINVTSEPEGSEILLNKCITKFLNNSRRELKKEKDILENIQKNIQNMLIEESTGVGQVEQKLEAIVGQVEQKLEAMLEGKEKEKEKEIPMDSSIMRVVEIQKKMSEISAGIAAGQKGTEQDKKLKTEKEKLEKEQEQLIKKLLETPASEEIEILSKKTIELRQRLALLAEEEGEGAVVPSPALAKKAAAAEEEVAALTDRGDGNGNVQAPAALAGVGAGNEASAAARTAEEAAARTAE